MEPVVTWYDILDVMPGAGTEEIQDKYDARASLLRPELIAGAPSVVITAASRAQQRRAGPAGEPPLRARVGTAGLRLARGHQGRGTAR